MSLEFRALASSSAGNCYLLSSGSSKPLLIDAGLRLKEIQRAVGFQLSNLAGCIISHGHGDHVRGIQGVLDRGVTCYASRETWMQLGVVNHHRAQCLCAEQPKQIVDWRVTPFDAVHDLPTYGFVIDGPIGGRLLYLTDTAYSKYRFEGLTHIAVECNYSRDLLMANTMRGNIHAERFKRTVRNHMSLERLIEMLRANDLSRVQEIHLLHLSDANSDEVEFADAVRRVAGVPVLVATRSPYRSRTRG